MVEIKGAFVCDWIQPYVTLCVLKNGIEICCVRTTAPVLIIIITAVELTKT